MSRLIRFVILGLLSLLPILSFGERVTWSAGLAPNSPTTGSTTVILKASVEKGWHFYATKAVEGGPVATTIEAVDPLKLNGAIKPSPPIKKHDGNFNLDLEFYEDSASFDVPVILTGDIANAHLKVVFQACNDKTCELPKTVEVPLTGGEAKAVVQKGDVDDSRSKGLLPFIGIAFTAGLLALITPCVFPMVPITVSFFSKRKENADPRAGVKQAVAFCFGIISAFTVVGILVSILFGASGIQQFATNPITNIVLAVIFVLLALNLFGLFELSLPSQLQNAFSPQKKTGLLAPLLMGLTFTMTSFTCTAPFVGTILVSASKGDLLYPFIGMLAFSTAFSLPFFLLALFPQYLARLPKSGSWLETVKAFMGFIEIAAAIKFVSNADLVWGTGLLARSTFLIVWAVILVAAALFLLNVVKLPKIEAPAKLGKGRIITVGSTSLVAAWLVFGATGQSLGELEAFLPPGKADGWTEDYARALQIARRDKKPLLIDFTGVTCTNCRWMEKNMFPRPDVTEKFNGYVLTKIFTDRAQDRANQALMLKLTQKVTLPIYVVLSPDEKVVRMFEGSTRQPADFVKFLSGS